VVNDGRQVRDRAVDLSKKPSGIPPMNDRTGELIDEAFALALTDVDHDCEEYGCDELRCVDHGCPEDDCPQLGCREYLDWLDRTVPRRRGESDCDRVERQLQFERDHEAAARARLSRLTFALRKAAEEGLRT
jgi:hypothetical protein